MEFAIFRPGLPHNLRRGGGKDSSHQRRDTKIGQIFNGIPEFRTTESPLSGVTTIRPWGRLGRQSEVQTDPRAI